MGLKSRGSVLLVGIWCLVTVVLANGYAGTLFSFLSVSKLQQPINSIEELAASSDITLLTQSETELTNRFLVNLQHFSTERSYKLRFINSVSIIFCVWQNATEGPSKIIGQTLRSHPENIFITSTSAGTIKMLMTGKHAFTFVFIAFKYLT